jgi:hypothetical protein
LNCSIFLQINQILVSFHILRFNFYFALIWSQYLCFFFLVDLQTVSLDKLNHNFWHWISLLQVKNWSWLWLWMILFLKDFDLVSLNCSCCIWSR